MPIVEDASTQTGASSSTFSPLADAKPALTILWHPDPSRVGAMFWFGDLAPGRSLQISRISPEFSCFTDLARPLSDSFLSRQPFLEIAPVARSLKVTPLPGQLPIALDGEPLRGPVSLSLTDLAGGPIVTLGRRIALCLHYAQAPTTTPDLGLMGHSDAIHAVRRSILAVADLAVPVLIRGESGTGKEITASAIVKAGPRSEKPFVSVNMGALPQHLAAAEILGHDKGAFTGSVGARPGYFVQAHGGTLFLDEIGLASPDVQASLLRVLETSEVRPIGGAGSRRVDVRILAATDAQLNACLAQGTFSRPLFHRLSSVQLHLPPLRERRDDFGLLLLHFLKEVMAQTGDLDKLRTPKDAKRPWLAATDVSALARARWLGNVRELRNCANQLAIANRGAPAAHLTPELLANFALQPEIPSAPSVTTLPATPQPITHAKLVDALARHDFQPARAARALRISRTTIYEHIRRDPSLGLLTRISDEQLTKELKASDGDLHALAKRLRVSYRALQIRLSRA